MDLVFGIVSNWLTGIKTILIMATILLLWLIVWQANDAMHASCADITSFSSFLKDGCIAEGIRNARWINKIFPVLLIVGFFVSFIISILGIDIDELKGRY